METAGPYPLHTTEHLRGGTHDIWQAVVGAVGWLVARAALAHASVASTKMLEELGAVNHTIHSDLQHFSLVGFTGEYASLFFREYACLFFPASCAHATAAFGRIQG